MNYAYSHRMGNRRSKELVKASIFCTALIFSLFVFLFTAFSQSDPIILGTEMNTNGMVEYLCLGNGCDHLQDMDW